MKDNLPVFLNKENMPMRVKRLLGCANCEWKNANLCPYGYQPAKGASGVHPEGICQERITYLVTFMPPDIQKPTFDEWRAFYDDARLQMESDTIYARMKKMERVIIKCEESLITGNGFIADTLKNRQDLDELKEQYNKLTIKWRKTVEQIQRRHTAKEAIKSRAKERNNTLELSIHDIRRLMRDDNIVDAEVVDEKQPEVKEDGTSR